MEDGNDDVDREKDPEDTFSEYSDVESEGGGFPVGMFGHPCGGGVSCF